MASTTAFGMLLLLISVATLSFATYALLRGGKGQRGGIGPITERGIHVIAGVRMLLIGLTSLAAGLYLLLG